jgi:hypothetical protein
MVVGRRRTAPFRRLHQTTTALLPTVVLHQTTTAPLHRPLPVYSFTACVAPLRQTPPNHHWSLHSALLLEVVVAKPETEPKLKVYLR